MRHASDTQREGFRAKADPTEPSYKAKVAEPIMAAIDAMPPAFRVLVHDFDYIDVYLAWKHGMSARAIRDAFTLGLPPRVRT